MTKPIHILNQLGVLTSFSVAKRITDIELEKFTSKLKKTGKSERQIKEMLHANILKEIQEAVLKNKIPGLISSEELAKKFGLTQSLIDKIPELNRLASALNQKLLEKKYDKMSLCYFINYLVNFIGLTEQDFENFHRQKEDNEEDDGDEPSDAAEF